MKNHLTYILILLSFTIPSNAQDQLYEELKDKISFVVAQDGSGDFVSISAALDSVRLGSIDSAVVYIKNGVYEEELFIRPQHSNFTLIGQNVDSTIITHYPTHGDEGFGQASVRIVTDDFLGLNLTIENSYGVGNQAEALATSSRDRQAFAHCRFIGFQDTYYSGSPKRNYFKDCLFIGAVDYIFGSSTVIFDSCQIHSLRDRSWITAANTKQTHRFGYVFQNCWVTSKYAVKDVYFGRPWNDYPKVTFMNCYLSDCMSPQGWDNTWYNPDNIDRVEFYEYKNYGPGSDTSQRISYSGQLSDEEAEAYVMDTIFGVNNASSITTEWSPNLDDNPYYVAVNKYFKSFLEEDVTKAKLSGLNINGETVAGFDPDGDEVNITLPPGTTDWPVLEAIPESPEMHTKIIYPDEIPGTFTVVVSSKYEAMHKAYTINIQHDQTIEFEISNEIQPIVLNQNIGNCATDITEINENDGLVIYPNPSKGIFTLNIRSYSSPEPVRVHVYNILGKSVYSNTFRAVEIKVDNQINLSGLPEGQYLINVYSASKDYSTKIILK